MKASDSGVALIRRFEGCELTAYLDAVGVLTIGVGHTGPDVSVGQTITEEQADDLLRADLEDTEHCVNSAVPHPLLQSEFDALVSFVFNVGCNAFRGSTLLKLILAGDMDGAVVQFTRWNKGRVKGELVELAGLTKRRKAEADLFEGVA